MKKHYLINALVCLLLAATVPTAVSKDLDYNFTKATPVGSWQLREDITTDHKGRQTVTQMRSSLIDEEMRDGEKHYWVEIAMTSFEVKKGKRRPSGDRVVMKSLMSQSTLQDNPANAVNNVRAFGKEIIMQSGDDDPIIISGAGGMAESMMQAMDTKVTYSYTVIGDEEVSVKAGTFPARKVEGSGSTEMKVVFKKITVTGKNTAWISEKVPFGMIKTEGESVTNGKKSTHISELLEFGRSGAVTQISKTPQELPKMPSMKDLFGR